MRTAGKEVVRARQEEPFLECFIEAYQPFILMMNFPSRCLRFMKLSSTTTRPVAASVPLLRW